MKDFKELKSQWESQPNISAPEKGSEKILAKMNHIKHKQNITKVVLIATTLVLVYFFYYINAFRNLAVAIGLLLMIGSLLLRICIEYVSVNKLKQLDVTSDVKRFKTAMKVYYQKRIQTHYIFTPIIFALYIIGFVILLPFFKDSLSQGFYTYVLVSGITVLIILSLFIAYEIKKELKILKQFTD